MRTGGAFETETLPPEYRTQQSEAAKVGRKSPVPYLFGGLAAMFGLIAFALLILACSYWKLSGIVDESLDDNNREGVGKSSGDNDKEKMRSVMVNSVVVIMAGDEKPTFLAMPIESNDCCCGGGGGGGGGGDEQVMSMVELHGCNEEGGCSSDVNELEKK